MLTIGCFIHISSSTLYGVTKLVPEVTKLVTHEESLTSDFVGKAEVEGRQGNLAEAHKDNQGGPGKLINSEKRPAC